MLSLSMMIQGVRSRMVDGFNVLSTSGTFYFNKPDEWKQRFEQIHVACELSDKNNKCQVNMLHYSLEANAKGILSTTNIFTKHWKNY